MNDDEFGYDYEVDDDAVLDNGRPQTNFGFPLIVATVILAVILIGIRLTFSSPSVASPITPTSSQSAFYQPTPTPLIALETAEFQQPPATPLPTVEIVQNAYQPLPPLSTEKRGLFSNGDRTERVVALTFDVGETADNPAGFDWGILEVLNERKIPATFFLGGLWMVHNEDETRVLAENPLFEIGNHAWSHLDFAQITPEEMSSEIVKTQKQMWELFGWQTTLFRLPYGTYTDEALNVIAEHGLLTIQWDVVSGDPDPNILADPMADWVLQQVQPGSIIIMHANGRGWNTAEALPRIISTLETEGYRFVLVSELLNLDTQQRP